MNVVSVMKCHPYDLDNTLAALKMFEVLAVMDFNMEDLVDNGAISAVLSVMVEHTQVAAVQAYGANALLYMATNEDNVELLLEDGPGVAPVLANLSAFPESLQVHHDSLVVTGVVFFLNELISIQFCSVIYKYSNTKRDSQYLLASLALVEPALVRTATVVIKFNQNMPTMYHTCVCVCVCVMENNKQPSCFRSDSCTTAPHACRPRSRRGGS
jgi:hypothetical protein